MPGRGKAALVSDPEGAPFGLIRTADGDPVDELGDDNTWLWGELWSRDPDAMAGFYQGLGVFSPKRENTSEAADRVLPDGWRLPARRHHPFPA